MKGEHITLQGGNVEREPVVVPECYVSPDDVELDAETAAQYQRDRMVDDMPPEHPLSRLRFHVTGAIERGEADPIIEIPAKQE